MAMYDDMPTLVESNMGAAPGAFPPEAIRPGGFGAGMPGPRRLAGPSGSRHTTPAGAYSRLVYDDAGFGQPVQDFGAPPPPTTKPSSILQHNPWLADNAAYHPQPQPQPQPHGRPYPGTPYHHPHAALSADADWPQHGRDFSLGHSFGSAPPEASGFGEGGFGQQFVGGFGRPPPDDDDDIEPVIPPLPDSMRRANSMHSQNAPQHTPQHIRSQSYSPGFASFPDFGQAPPQAQAQAQGFAQTPPAGMMDVSPEWGNFWRRANSSGSSTPQNSHLPLSAHPGYASGPRHQYNRPNDWRTDFTMPRKVSLSERLGLTRVLSVGKVFQGDPKNAPHRTLDGSNAASPACIWDARLPPNTLRLPSGPPLSYLELQEAAFTQTPKNGRVILVHELLPWALTLTAGVSSFGTPTVITVGHLIHTIHSELHRQIFESDFWNDAVGEGDRARIHKAWSTRCSVLADVAVGEEQTVEREAKCREYAAQGVKRIDFLGNRTLFYGLKRRAVNGGEVWEMRFRKVDV